MLVRREEESVAGMRQPVLEADALEHPVLSLEPLHGFADQHDSIDLEPSGHLGLKLRLSIRAQDDLRRPPQQFERELGGCLFPAIDCHAFAAVLPTIAIWAMMNRTSIKLLNPGNPWDL